jgi:glycylpeptide N-tetradecanoyltransferase
MSESQDTKGKAPAEEETSSGDLQSSTTREDATDVSALAASLKKKIKKGKGSDGEAGEGSDPKPASRITENMAESLLELNPSLKAELAGVDKKKATEVLQKMDVADLMTGLSVGGKNQKDMASYKFWQTQPVPRFDDKKEARVQEGPIKMINPEEVSKEPDPLIEGFEWVTLDLTDEKELQELYDLLTFHYVEDDAAMFRFNYSASFLNWYVDSSYPLPSL